VKQQCPRKLEDAVRITLEVESYLVKPSTVGQVEAESELNESTRKAYLSLMSCHLVSAMCQLPFTGSWHIALSGMLWTECLAYLDDIIIFGRTFKDHLNHLASMLRILHETNLKAKPSKCAFLWKQVLYLGHNISSEGIATDPNKTQRIAVLETAHMHRMQ